MNAQIKLLVKSGLAKDLLLALARDYWSLDTFGLANVDEGVRASLRAADERLAEIVDMSDEEVIVRTVAWNVALEESVSRPITTKEEIDNVDAVVDKIMEWAPDNDDLRDLQDWAQTTLYMDADLDEGCSPLSKLTPKEWRAKMYEDALLCVREQKTRLDYEESKVKHINDAVAELKNANI